MIHRLIVISIRADTKKTKNMEMASLSGRAAIGMKESISRTNAKDREICTGQMAPFTAASGCSGLSMEQANLFCQLARKKKAILRTTFIWSHNRINRSMSLPKKKINTSKCNLRISPRQQCRSSRLRKPWRRRSNNESQNLKLNKLPPQNCLPAKPKWNRSKSSPT